MNKFLDYLHLREVGLLEMLIAFFPILLGYTISGLPLGIVLCTLLVLVLFLRKGSRKNWRRNPILWFLVFMVVHDIFLLSVINNAQGVFLNSLIGQCAYLVAAIVVGNDLNYNKLRGSVNWVSLLCMGGMLYHFSLVLRGMSFQPIMLPFMPEQTETSRFLHEYYRPTSFFQEAQSYASYMLVTLFMALVERKYIWSVLIAITIFMSSSTTGLVTVFIIFALVALSGSTSKNKRFITVLFMFVIGGGLLYFLLRSGLFEQGTTKMFDEAANMDEEIRLVQGPMIVGSMSFTDWIFGVPYANAYQYCMARGIAGSVIIYGENSMFVPTFWLMLIRYGIVGLLLYLNIYWYYYRLDKTIRPYIISLILLLFTNPDFVGGMFAYSMFVIISFCRFNLNESYTYRVRLGKSNA